MAIYHQPQGDRKHHDLIRYFRPSGSQTVVWAQDMDIGRLLRLLRWGSEIYLPVYDGMKLGIGVFNGNTTWRAYPTYIEGRNLWDNGQPQPEDCDTDHMWELKHGQQQVFDKLMNPDGQVGRPLIITETGFDNTVGEATFHTDEFHGQIRVYERIRIGGGYQFDRPVNKGVSDEPIFLGSAPESFGLDQEWRGATPKGLTRGSAGIGAGAEEHQSHSETGVRYQRNAQPVVSLRVEYREDLRPMLDLAWGHSSWDWFEPIPSGHYWWEQPWNWRLPTAPEVPVIKPHRPNNYR